MFNVHIIIYSITKPKFQDSGGIDFSVSSAGYNSIETMCPCHAWMVPIVDDEGSMIQLMWDTEKHTFTFGSKTLEIEIGVLKRSSEFDGECLVRIINGKKYAVMKRGLL